MRTRRFQLTLIVLTAVLFLTNWYARKRLPESYARQLAYNQLYLDPGVLRIKYAKSDESALKIGLAGEMDMLATNIPRQNFIDNCTLQFLPGDAGRLYWIKQPRFDDTVLFSIAHTPAEFYQSAGNSEKGEFEINSSSLVFSDAPLTTYKTWEFDFLYLKNADIEKTRLKTYLRDSVGITESDNSLIKLKKIFSHLRPFVQSNLGVPPDSLQGMLPLELLTVLKSGKTKVWCDNLSAMLGAFATSAGLPTRLVTTEGYDSFSYPVHAFNEVFIHESGCWIYSDLTTGIVYMKAGTKPLNVVQINRLLRAGLGSGQGVEAITFNDTIQSVEVSRLPPSFHGYFGASQRFRFYYPEYLMSKIENSAWDRINRFFRPAYNYAYYSEDNHYISYAFRLRWLSTYLMIFIFILDLAVILNNVWRRYR